MIIAAILEPPAIGKILTHLGLQPKAPPKASAGEVAFRQRCQCRACRSSDYPNPRKREGAGADGIVLQSFPGSA